MSEIKQIWPKIKQPCPFCMGWFSKYEYLVGWIKCGTCGYTEKIEEPKEISNEEG